MSLFEFKDYPDREMLAMEVANRLAGDLKTALGNHESVTLTVPGGPTPGPIFDVLCAADLDWDRVRVMLSDERWVPLDHARSNTGLIKSRLLTDRAAHAHYVPLYMDGSAEKQVPKLAETLTACLPISVLLLGMGADMHTASLFPGAKNLSNAFGPDGPVLSVQHPEDQPEARVSLSAPVLNGALAKHLVITGRDKREALERAIDLPPELAPIRAVLKDMTVHWAE